MPLGDSRIQAKVGEQVEALVDDNRVAAALHARARLSWQCPCSAKHKKTYHTLPWRRIRCWAKACTTLRILAS